MKFSIVTPLYNKGKYIADTISSVLSQTYTDFEFIIVNDSSTDNSIEIVQSFSDKRIKLFSKPNGGVSAARNYGIEQSQGEYICFLDADDLWYPTYLEERNALINQFPSAGFICGAFKIFKESSSNIIGISNLSAISGEISKEVDFFKYSLLKGGSIALTSAVIIQSLLLKKMKYVFPEGVSIGEDVDTWFRVAKHTVTIYHNKPLMLYRAATEGGLTTSYTTLNHSFKYWFWYKHCTRREESKFCTLMIYLLAKKCYLHKDYDGAIKSLLKARGDYYLFKRIYILSSSLAHKYLLKTIDLF